MGVKISGYVETEKTQMEWLDAFMEWIESRKESFGGITAPVPEPYMPNPPLRKSHQQCEECIDPECKGYCVKDSPDYSKPRRASSLKVRCADCGKIVKVRSDKQRLYAHVCNGKYVMDRDVDGCERLPECKF